MMKQNDDYRKEHMAKAVGRSLPISAKVSIEICNSIRNKQLSSAKELLRRVADEKMPVKFTRFTNGAGHKKGIGAGKCPVKAAKEILGLLESAEANAQFKGLNTSDLMIKKVMANKAGNVWRFGRFRRRRMKRTNIEVILEEGKRPADKEKKQKSKAPAEKKEQSKKADIDKKTVQPENRPAEKKEGNDKQ